MSATPLPTAPPEGDEHIVRKANAGARLLTARGAAMRFVSIGSNLALFALVTPADFGLLAVVRGITGLAGNTSDLGFAWALIRRADTPSREEYGALAGIQLSIIMIVVGVVLMQPSLLASVGSVAPEWRWWMVGTLATTLAIPFGTNAKIRIERALEYRRIAIYDITSVLLLNLTLLGFALAQHFTVGAFVATGATILYSNLLLTWWSPGPGPNFQLRTWRGLAGEFAGFSTGHLASLLYNSATPIVVAHFFGLPGAGIWSFATRLGNILQVTFEGFRRAIVPAAAKLTQSLPHLRQLVNDSLLGAARLAVPAMAALVAGLPVLGLLWPRWESAVRLSQLYVIGFGLAGLLSASMVPAAVALRGASVVVVEQSTPMIVGWISFLVIWWVGGKSLAPAIPPMFLATIVALWHVSDRAVRPSWNPELTRLALGLALVTGLTIAGQAQGWPPVLVAAVAAALFGLVWWDVRALLRQRATATAGE